MEKYKLILNNENRNGKLKQTTENWKHTTENEKQKQKKMNTEKEKNCKQKTNLQSLINSPNFEQWKILQIFCCVVVLSGAGVNTEYK